MTREQFERLAADAVARIPDKFREAMRNIAIIIDDLPDPEVLEQLGVEPPDTLLGLYEGVPLPERQWDHGNVLPDRIFLFRDPIEEASETDDEVVVTIGETLIHEVGHYFGLSEEEIEDIEEHHWRRRA
jgi:predicted Zn-dependent protease with MMP-like domain